MSLLVTACVVFVTFLPGQSPAQPGEADALARARAVLEAIAAKDFSKVEQQFDDKVKAALPPGRLEALWSGLQIQLGAFTQGRISGLAFRPAAAPPVPYALPSYANAASIRPASSCSDTVSAAC